MTRVVEKSGYSLDIGAFTVGTTVEVHPACDCWMRGDRFGEVVKVTQRNTVHVSMQRSKKTRVFRPGLLQIVYVED